MKKSFKSLMSAGLVVMGIVSIVGTGQPVAAVDCSNADNKAKPVCATQSGIDATGTKRNTCGPNAQACTVGNSVQTIVNVLLFLIGTLSVIMIIIGGIRYVLSNGDSSQIAAAKNTILYAVIGLIVALLAYAIVDFVVKQFK